MSRDLRRQRNQSVMWLYVWEPLIVNYHPAKFGGNRRCGSGNVNIPANTNILLQMRDIRDYIYAGLLQPLLFSVKHMACHVSHAPRITT